MTRPRTHVSDHAVLRYLQRVGGFDIDGLRAAIAVRVDAAACAGASGVVIDGFVFRIRRDVHGPVVTTVMPAGLAPGRPEDP